MKILIFGSRMDLISGHSRPAYELASQMVQRGHQVRILSTALNEQRLSRHQSMTRREAYLRLPPTERSIGSNKDLLLPNSDLAQQLSDIVDWADVFHGFSLWSSLQFLRRFGGSLPAVLTLNTYPFASISDYQSTGGFSLRVALTPSIMLSLILSRIRPMDDLRRFQRIISWTEFLRDAFVNEGVPGDRISTIPVGIDMRRFRNRRCTGSNFPRILYFGLLTPARGPEGALRAFTQFLRLNPSAQLIIADREFHRSSDRGYLEKERSRISHLIQDFSLTANVKVQGFTADILSLIASVDLVLLPFTSPFGYSHPPLTVIEALAMGKPVVSTRTGSVPEVLAQDGLGFLTSSTDPSRMAQLMAEAIDGDHAGLRQSRLEWVRRVHRWEPAADMILGEYQAAIAELD